MGKEFLCLIFIILLSGNSIIAGPLIGDKGGYISGPNQNDVAPTMPSVGDISINLPTSTHAQIGLLPPVSTRVPPKKYKPKPNGFISKENLKLQNNWSPRKNNNGLAQEMMKGLLDGVESFSKIFAPGRLQTRRYNTVNELNRMGRYGDISGIGGLSGMSGLSGKSASNGINGFFEMLFTGEEKPKPTLKTEDLLSKFLLVDKKPSLQINTALLTEVAGQAGKFFSDLPSQIVSQAFQMVMENLLARIENFILGTLGRFDEYMLTVIKAFVMEALMQFQGTLLDKLKDGVLRLISVTEIDTVTKVLRTISALMNEQKLNIMSHVKSNIFGWLQIPPMFQMLF